MRENKHNPGKFSLKKRLISFRYAFVGLKILWTDEHNFRIHILATVLVVSAGFFIRISSGEWIAIILSIGLVLAAETFNTAIEILADFVSPARHEKIKKIKDLAAAGVLLAAGTALIVGLIIFLPRFIRLF